MLDELYQSLREKGLSEGTVRYVHVALGACLRAAVRKKKLALNPKDAAEAPSTAVNEEDGGRALEQDVFIALVKGFRDNPLFPLVATAAYTGARRGEILALRWSDFDADAKTLRIKDLRSTHETLLLDAGVPVHVVAARGGHDPATLLKSYAKRTRKADMNAAAVISGLSRGTLRGS
jgi:integrase